MGFQLRSACGGECTLLFERAPLPKARRRIFLFCATLYAFSRTWRKEAIAPKFQNLGKIQIFRAVTMINSKK